MKRTGGPRSVRALVTVKTYPTPSKTYSELVCTAAVVPNEGFIRLFPIQFRDLPYERWFKKYDWINVSVEPHGGRDRRPDSYRPIQDSIEVVGRVGTSHGWAERKRLILPFASPSLEELDHRRKAYNGASLGIFRPAEVFDFEWRPTEREWSGTDHAKLTQRSLFGQDRTPLQKLPFEFRYRFRCDDPQCTGEHHIMILDWEVGALFLSMRELHGEAAALEKVRDKFLGELCGPDRDTHFFMGTTHVPFEAWLILGVFWPPRETQPSLFESASVGPASA